MIDLNSKTMLSDRINYLINDAIINESVDKPHREYLGASLVGHECDRKVQYEWMAVQGQIPPEGFDAQTLRRFDRGNVYEYRARKWLQGAGFIFFAPNNLEISDFDGKFRGHVDGIIAGFYPGDSPLALPALWECKCLASKGWKALEKDGLRKYSPTYFGQVQIYMHYLKLQRCLFTVVNADSMELAHYLIDYSEMEAALIKAKISSVFTATKLGEMLPRCTDDPEYYVCKWCPFREECWKK
jgi:hypothetical protein